MPITYLLRAVGALRQRFPQRPEARLKALRARRATHSARDSEKCRTVRARMP